MRTKAINVNQMSRHASVDRRDRVVVIEAIGYGVPIATITDDRHGSDPVLLTLTSTGVIFIRNPETNKIVTLYLASYNQALFIYRKAYGKKKRLPNDTERQIRMNTIMFPES